MADHTLSVRNAAAYDALLVGGSENLVRGQVIFGGSVLISTVWSLSVVRSRICRMQKMWQSSLSMQAVA